MKSSLYVFYHLRQRWSWQRHRGCRGHRSWNRNGCWRRDTLYSWGISGCWDWLQRTCRRRLWARRRQGSICGHWRERYGNRCRGCLRSRNRIRIDCRLHACRYGGVNIHLRRGFTASHCCQGCQTHNKQQARSNSVNWHSMKLPSIELMVLMILKGYFELIAYRSSSFV